MTRVRGSLPLGGYSEGTTWAMGSMTWRSSPIACLRLVSTDAAMVTDTGSPNDPSASEDTRETLTDLKRLRNQPPPSDPRSAGCV